MKTSAVTLPNFFLAGAPKSGTTSLYHYLDQHPEIYMSPIKETNYFASEIRVAGFSESLRPRAEQDAPKLRKYLDGDIREKRFGGIVTEWSDYLKLFEQVDGERAIGEASVCYLWSESAPVNIARCIPDAKTILVLRNPLETVFSMYLQSRRGGAFTGSFAEALKLGLRQRGGPIDLMHPFLDLGLYYEQVTRFLETFAAERVGIYWYEDYRQDASAMLADVFRFLNVDPDFRPDLSRRYLESGDAQEMEPADRALLISFYRDDIQKLASLLKRDLSNWVA